MQLVVESCAVCTLPWGSALPAKAACLCIVKVQSLQLQAWLCMYKGSHEFCLRTHGIIEGLYKYTVYIHVYSVGRHKEGCIQVCICIGPLTICLCHNLQCKAFWFAPCATPHSSVLLDKTACALCLFFAASCTKSRVLPCTILPIFLKTGRTISMDA